MIKKLFNYQGKKLKDIRKRMQQDGISITLIVIALTLLVCIYKLAESATFFTLIMFFIAFFLFVSGVFIHAALKNTRMKFQQRLNRLLLIFTCQMTIACVLVIVTKVYFIYCEKLLFKNF